MRIGSVLENQENEKRISITPDVIKKYNSLGFEVLLSENYGRHIGINDDEYLKLGVKISKDDKEILSSSDIIVQLGMLSDGKSSIMKEHQILMVLQFGLLLRQLQQERVSQKISLMV